MCVCVSVFLLDTPLTVACLCCRKDVRLPVQLQRAMAAEAEAAREARAKVSVQCVTP